MPQRIPSIRPHVARDYRQSARKRGYSRDWELLSRRVRTEDPLCVLCEQAGRITPATEVHHIQSVRAAPGRRLDRSNLMPLCAECHRRMESGQTIPGGSIL